MKSFCCLLAALLGLSCISPSKASVPYLLNSQGRILVGTTNFQGTGQFKFALVGLQPNAGRQATATAQVFPFGGVLLGLTITDGGAGYATPPRVTFHHPSGQGAQVEAIVSKGAVTGFNYIALGSNYTSTLTVTIAPPPAKVEISRWSNDGTSQAGSPPARAVSLPVERGLYSVLLGDSTLTNMTPLTPAVFADPEMFLRVWFNDGLSGFQQLAPDQRLAAVAFALRAATVPDGSITSAQLDDAAVTATKLAPGAVSAAALTPGAVTSVQIEDGSIVDADISANANLDAGKIGSGDLRATRLRVGTNHTFGGSALLATIAGGQDNTATASWSVIGGGRNNSVGGSYGTVAGGHRNSANNSYAAIGGGNNNTAGALYATVSGGHYNEASGPYAAIGGGDLNAANNYATVPGGYENVAAGDYSFAAGRRALAAHPGAFVWGDSTDQTIASTGENQFIIRAAGGAWLGTNSTPALTNGALLGTSTGAFLSAGGAWTDNSDRDAKENFQPVDPGEVLARVAELSISTWNYRNEGEDVRHLGPVAQDFHQAFQLGPDARHLAALDSAGVALAAIQGLHQLVRQKDDRIAALEQAVAQLQERLDRLHPATADQPATP